MKIKSYGLMLTTVMFGVIAPVQSAYAIDAMQILINISATVGPLQQLASATAYLMGLAFIFRAIYSLKMYAQNVSMMSQQNSMKTPMGLLLAGSMLLYLPTAMNIMMMTTFGQTSILGYSTNNSSYYGQSLNAVLLLVQLVGVVSFIRGWIILGQASSAGGHQGASFGKALTHIIGGILATNMVLFMKVIGNTTGIDVGL